MRRIFLTSGLVLCLACPAFADIAAGTSSASCKESVLGSTTGPVDFTSEWRPMISGTIKLDSQRYTSNDGSPVTPYTTNLSVPEALYAVYGVGVYAARPTVETLSNFTTNNSMTSLTSTPTRTGYTFSGFYTTKATGGTQVIAANGDIIYPDASTQVTTEGDTSTWYARWTPSEARIHYGCGFNNLPYVEGLNISPRAGNGPETTDGYYDEYLTLASTEEDCSLDGDRGGYHFGGWECDANGATGTYTPVTYQSTLNQQGVWTVSQTVGPWKIPNATTCEVVWTPNIYNVTYDHGIAGSRTTGFSGSVSGTTAVFGQDQVTIEGNNFSIPGYTFDGWVGDYDNASGDATPTDYSEGDVLDPYIIGHDLTLTAKWSAKHYTVTYNSGSCTNSPNTTVYTHSNGATYDSNYTVPAAANNAISVKTGYTFVGWNTVTGQTTNNFPDASATPWTRTNGITVYAACSPNSHTVSYSCGSGSCGTPPSNGSANYGQSYNLSSTYGSCAKEGHHATGWDCSGGATLNNATGSQNANTWSSEATISCSVHWVANTVNLNYYQDANANSTFTTGTCTYGSTFNLPSTNLPTKPGYHINGWNIRGNGSASACAD